MKFFIKSCIFAVLISTVVCRSITSERNLLNSSEDASSPCSCEWRFLKHYETKGCYVEEEDSCGCPTKFACPSNATDQDSKVCKYRDKEYRVGSKIITSDACQVCRCYDDVPPRIKCFPRECPPLDPPQGENCHLVYKANKCCPSGYECVDQENQEQNITDFTCEYKGKLYPLGAKIYPTDDPCQTCDCDENWNGVNNSSCYQQECIFEKKMEELEAGCIPVYHESRCCPIEFYCPDEHRLNFGSVPENDTMDEISEPSGDYCIFGGHMYQAGSELKVNNICIKCSCQVPPDVTCIHQSCALPPSANCLSHYNPEECCPRYDCLLADGQTSESATNDTEPVCPTPICADETCHIDIPPGHECPTCICKEVNFDPESTEKEQLEFHEDRFFENEGGDDFIEVEISSNMPYFDVGAQPERMIQLENETYINEIIDKENYEPDQLEPYVDDDNEILDLEADKGLEAEIISTLQLDNYDESTNLQKNDSLQEEDTHESLGAVDKEAKEQDQISLQKRSEYTQAVPMNSLRVPSQQQISWQQMQPIKQQPQMFNEDLEREDGTVRSSSEDYDGELESFREKATVQKTGNEISSEENTSVDFSNQPVPAGCPTPMCANSSCRIGIPSGHRCPTCICRDPSVRQP